MRIQQPTGSKVPTKIQRRPGRGLDQIVIVAED